MRLVNQGEKILTDGQTLRSKKIWLGQNEITVTYPVAHQPLFANVVTEVNLLDGIVHLGLASLTKDGSGEIEAELVARLRIPLSTLMGLQLHIQGLVSQAEEAKKSAN